MSDEEFNKRLEEALDMLYGPRESFRETLSARNVLKDMCHSAECVAKRKRLPVWSVIGQWTGHGSGVSAAIHHIYKKQDSKHEQNTNQG